MYDFIEMVTKERIFCILRQSKDIEEAKTYTKILLQLI